MSVGVAERPSTAVSDTRTAQEEWPLRRRDVSGVDPQSVDLSSEEWKAFETVGGHLKERATGFESEMVGQRIGAAIDEYLRRRGREADRPIGYTAGSNSVYRCFKRSLKSTRKPDASYLSADLCPDGPPRGEVDVPPELIVEVVSPNESFDDAFEKVDDFFGAGTRMAWVVSPVRRFALAMFPDGTARRIAEGESLDGGDVLPGLSIPLSDLLWDVPVVTTEDAGDPE